MKVKTKTGRIKELNSNGVEIVPAESSESRYQQDNSRKHKQVERGQSTNLMMNCLSGCRISPVYKLYKLKQLLFRPSKILSSSRFWAKALLER